MRKLLIVCLVVALVGLHCHSSGAIKKKLIKKFIKATLYGKALGHSKVIIPLLIPIPFTKSLHVGHPVIDHGFHHGFHHGWHHPGFHGFHDPWW